MTNPRHSDFCHVVGFCHILWLFPWDSLSCIRLTVTAALQILTTHHPFQNDDHNNVVNIKLSRFLSLILLTIQTKYFCKLISLLSTEKFDEYTKLISWNQFYGHLHWCQLRWTTKAIRLRNIVDPTTKKPIVEQTKTTNENIVSKKQNC